MDGRPVQRLSHLGHRHATVLLCLFSHQRQGDLEDEHQLAELDRDHAVRAPARHLGRGGRAAAVLQPDRVRPRGRGALGVKLGLFLFFVPEGPRLRASLI